MPALCRDCDAICQGPACMKCGGVRILSHPELFTLAIAHIDCDAFYASVEKRDHPELRDKPLIVGGGVRGVVSTCCYIARIHGVRSAMPMFKAKQLCPNAVVLRPDMAKYAIVSRQVREMMEALTPLVQPLSIDEAALDLSGTQALHGAPPAIVLTRLARRIETELGITISIGLARNRMLAKLAAERGKPRGFAVLGAEAAQLLANEKVGLLPGIGPAQVKKLEAMGLVTIAQLAALEPHLAARLGNEGMALVARARLEDNRPVRAERESKSISAETTFETDLSDRAALEAALWPLCEKLGRRLHREDVAAAGLVLKLKTADFQQRTRSQRLPAPTRLPETIFEAAQVLLAAEATGPRFRLIGIGASPLAPAAQADLGDLADTSTPRRRARQDAIDALRLRFGEQAVQRGRSLRPPRGKD
ncbi:DNA polymerase IV [Acidocella facilis]|uniref:DNA polymerase IV n=1 Tax=Acidocella facilis TaxID=525 RepID=UPI00047C4AF4|nr:DNA polymerase IV [Acidocella facilis]